MKILLGTHQLEVRAGSELFITELASSFRARGHDVAVFTFFRGLIADLLEEQGIPVFDPDDVRGICGLKPDVVQTIHLFCAHYLRSLVPDAMRVHAMLGVAPHLEAPPADAEGFDLGLAISEEVIEKIRQTPFGRSVEIALFRNWFDDRIVTTADRHPANPTARIAVVSNHVAPELTHALTTLEAAGEAATAYFGVEHASVPVDGSLLLRHDLVISIGRTAILAAACGVPCLMADIHGSDGLLTADNLDLARTVNFSGRLHRRAITEAYLREQIGRLGSFDRNALRTRVLAEYSLRSRVDWLLSRYEALLASRRDGATGSIGHPPSWIPSEGLAYAETSLILRQTRQELDKARNKLAELKQGQQGWRGFIRRRLSSVR